MSTAVPEDNSTKLILVLAACFGLLGFLLSNWLFTNTDGPDIGSEVNDIALRDIHGDKFALSDLRGKPVLINFWATWCPPCIEELPMLDAAHQRGDLVLVAYAQDDPAQVREFTNKIKLHARVVLESDTPNLGTQFKAPGVLPFSVLLDAQGKVVYTHRGLMQEADLKKALALAN